eukprot:3122737-Pyramimonas_sp.AAC.1
MSSLGSAAGNLRLHAWNALAERSKLSGPASAGVKAASHSLTRMSGLTSSTFFLPLAAAAAQVAQPTSRLANCGDSSVNAIS